MGLNIRNILYEILISDGEVTELWFHPSSEWLLAVIDHSMLFQIYIESQLVTKVDLQMILGQPLKTLSFSSDGTLLAGGGKNSIQIWDTNSWEVRDTQISLDESIERMLFTSDDSQLIVLADAGVYRWSVANDKLNFVSEFESYPDKRACLIRDGDISPDESLLVTADDCNQIRMWDLNLDTEILVPQLDFSSDRPQETLQFSPDGRYLLSGSSVRGWIPFFVYQPELND